MPEVPRLPSSPSVAASSGSLDPSLSVLASLANPLPLGLLPSMGRSDSAASLVLPAPAGSVPAMKRRFSRQPSKLAVPLGSPSQKSPPKKSSRNSFDDSDE